MAARRRTRARARTAVSAAKPAFPYTTRPAALRKFLSEVPRKPRPPRVNGDLLAGWGLSGGENLTIVRVLKALGLLNNSGEPTDVYTAFMATGSGPVAMGTQIRSVYAPLFNAAHEPHREPDDRLRNLFNIHSAGAPTTITFQMQTFKALCDYADFSATSVAAAPPVRAAAPGVTTPTDPSPGQPQVHIDLHIHLPPDKSSRDYQYIIQDIAKFIFGRAPEGRGE